MSGANEFGGAAKFGPHASRRNLRLGLATPNQRARKGLNTGSGFDRHRFASKHGLVEKNFAVCKLHIRRDHPTQRQLHQIARHQLRGWRGLPHPVPFDRGGQREPRLQRGKRRLGAAFLEESERGVEHQEKGDDRCLDIFAKHQLEHDGGFEHPRHRRPELLQRHA
jgi:hypothetical protein